MLWCVWYINPVILNIHLIICLHCYLLGDIRDIREKRMKSEFSCMSLSFFYLCRIDAFHFPSISKSELPLSSDRWRHEAPKAWVWLNSFSLPRPLQWKCVCDSFLCFTSSCFRYCPPFIFIVFSFLQIFEAQLNHYGTTYFYPLMHCYLTSELLI